MFQKSSLCNVGGLLVKNEFLVIFKLVNIKMFDSQLVQNLIIGEKLLNLLDIVYSFFCLVIVHDIDF